MSNEIDCTWEKSRLEESDQESQHNHRRKVLHAREPILILAQNIYLWLPNSTCRIPNIHCIHRENTYPIVSTPHAASRPPNHTLGRTQCFITQLLGTSNSVYATLNSVTVIAYPDAFMPVWESISSPVSALRTLALPILPGTVSQRRLYVCVRKDGVLSSLYHNGMRTTHVCIIREPNLCPGNSKGTPSNKAGGCAHPTVGLTSYSPSRNMCPSRHALLLHVRSCRWAHRGAGLRDVLDHRLSRYPP